MLKDSSNSTNRKTLRSLSLALIGFAVLLMFQNCGQEYDTGSVNPASGEEIFAGSLPFAYEFDIDQISYMSCNGNSLSSDPKYFTFKVGAYGEDSGVYLRDAFRTEAERGKLYGKKMADALSVAERNVDAGLVLALRGVDNLQSTYAEDRDNVGSILFDRTRNLSFSQTDIAEQLVEAKAGEKINFFNLPGLSTDRSLDGQIVFSESEGFANSIRSILNKNQSVLALTYGTRTGENETYPGQRARSQYDPAGLLEESGSNVFGKGYSFKFGQYDSYMLGAPSRAIDRISLAVNLENQRDLDESWTCPSDEKYIIVRPQDAHRGYAKGFEVSLRNNGVAIDMQAETYRGTYITSHCNSGNSDCVIENDEAYTAKVVCPMLPDDISTNALAQQKWKRVRNMLSHEDWYVFRGTELGMNYNCIVAKSDAGSCYGDDVQNIRGRLKVQYQNDETYPSFIEDERPVSESGCGNGTQNICPHIMSVCYKR